MVSFIFKCCSKRLFRLSIVVLATQLLGCGDDENKLNELTLVDGSIYIGELDDGLLNGQGQLTYLNGSVYEGSFVDGAFEGKGKITYSNGDVYRGDFVKGSGTGKAEYVTEHGVTYFGDFYNDDAHGILKITSEKENYTYYGEVDKWYFSGYGEFVQGDKQYRGQFSRGMYAGLGYYVDGELANYAGQFVDGLFNGLGVYQTENATYAGNFVDGEFSGQGVVKIAGGTIFSGEFKDWNLHGHGKSIDPVGNVIVGQFEYGQATGHGKYFGVDGERYIGAFKYGQFEGVGTHYLKNGSVYKGEFSYGRYQGQGRLEKALEDGGVKVEQGRWQYGRLVYNEITGEDIAEQSEVALEHHQVNLKQSIDGLLRSDVAQRNLYFLGFAGDGTQSVFRREINYVHEQLNKRFDLDGRSIKLINDHKTADKYPLATRRSLNQALNGIAEKIDKDNDILFLYLTSHGSKRHNLTVKHDSIRLPDLSAEQLKQAVEDTGIKWKVIFVSACYSGGFIPYLDDGNSLIITAADATNTSFGCSDDSELTYFAKAYFREVFSQESSMSLDEAFDKAKEVVSEWEKEEELTASNPQILNQPKVVEFLNEMQR